MSGGGAAMQAVSDVPATTGSPSVTFDLSGDLGPAPATLAVVLALASLGLLAFELVRRGARAPRWTWMIFVTGALGVVALLGAVLRPVRVSSKDTLLGPRVVVLLDGSRSVDLPGLDGTRREAAVRAAEALLERGGEVREALMVFGDGAPVSLEDRDVESFLERRPLVHSDLTSALEDLATSPEERPAAIVVLSDGRLERPSAIAPGDEVRTALGPLDVPVHTIALATESIRDASIRSVGTAGAAVAHQPVELRIEVGCDKALSCGEIAVTVRELREEGEPTLIASGTAEVGSGSAVVELSATLHRAGVRILEVAIDAPEGDALPDNDRRFLAVPVARDRVRVLHVAGRPTYDVRALRMWLKSDESVDVVAFFILRTPDDRVDASQDELALIPFPVDELFTEHLPSFDAVVLQDFNAELYGLSKHFAQIARYVDRGGGLIMVGGPDAFGPGKYAETELSDVLPVQLTREHERHGTDLGLFTPHLTPAGRVAPVLRPLRELIGDRFPEMPGTNVVGQARPGATVLLTHPTIDASPGVSMPVLALGEHGSGRTIALTIDGSHNLLFSAFAADAAGRAHGAFWDALLGWLMRDPRFEPASLDVDGACLASEETTLIVRPLPGERGTATLTVRRMGKGEVVHTGTVEFDDEPDGVRVPVGRLSPGGYSAVVEIATGDSKAPTTRRDFACEAGGDEWADVRPDVERLREIAKATGGQFAEAGDAGGLPLPAAIRVSTERKVTPLAPPWVWTGLAAALLGAHWFLRRRSGLS